MNKVKGYIGIYEIVKKIPGGKVGTYSQISALVTKKLKDKKISARVVGFALHVNPDPKNIPCHRVIKKDGSLARGYAYGGRDKQKKRLLDEGVGFVGGYKVDMKKYLWRSSQDNVRLRKVYK